MTSIFWPKNRQHHCHRACIAMFIGLCGIVFHLSVVAQTNVIIASEQPDLEKTYQEELDKWMLQAYEGDRDAQFRVGVLFTNEQFGSPDYEQAVYWYKQAARQGHVLGQYNLGHQYLNGVGVERDVAKAMKWWLEAAKLDHSLAQFNVGRAYYLGIGLEENHKKARYWFTKAADNNEPKSIEILQELGWEYDRNAPQADDSIISDEEILANLAQEQATLDQQQASINDTVIADDEPLAPTTKTNSPPASSSLTLPIAVYTNPAIRSVLIAIIDDQNQLTPIKRQGIWTIVSNTNGFPVWVNRNFISVSDDIGTITGNAVNARSVPIVTNGTVVGKLQQGELVMVMDKVDDWYRVMSPTRFQAWVKTDDLQQSSSPTIQKKTPAVLIKETKKTSPELSVESDNDNDWLFKQDPSHYTLQLASFDDEEKINAFIARSSFSDSPELHRFTSKSKEIQWTYFLYGSYADRETAEGVKQSLRQKRAWIRTFGRLQQNRCVAWKKQLPPPKKLNTYCVD